MAKVSGEKTLNVDLPETLYDELDGIAALFPPFKKKHVVMAAIGAFVAMSRDAQMQTILDAQQRYYWKATGEMPPARGADSLTSIPGEGGARPNLSPGEQLRRAAAASAKGTKRKSGSPQRKKRGLA